MVMAYYDAFNRHSADDEIAFLLKAHKREYEQATKSPHSLVRRT